MPKVSQQELELAFDWVASGYGNEAYISRSTGQIYWASEDGATDVEDDLPDDISDADKYLMVPSKQELDLGSQLAVDFVSSALPGSVDDVRRIFRRKGAYGRFKALLERHGVLERWYAYESKEELEALKRWCNDNDVELQPDQRA